MIPQLRKYGLVISSGGTFELNGKDYSVSKFNRKYHVAKIFYSGVYRHKIIIKSGSRLEVFEFIKDFIEVSKL